MVPVKPEKAEPKYWEADDVPEMVILPIVPEPDIESEVPLILLPVTAGGMNTEELFVEDGIEPDGMTHRVGVILNLSSMALNLSELNEAIVSKAARRVPTLPETGAGMLG